ncbi:MAG: type IX secretion system sortase PorU [Bacteroidaceae bacterium]|nr:type IX secretion system sortase PorU [Bacteroidaceae bacterium]
MYKHIHIAGRKRIGMVLAFMLAHIAAFAQFTQLDWQELRIDSVLPCYTEVVPLESDYRLHDYRVEVTYPEWEPLTADEVKVAMQHTDQLADTLRIYSHVGVSRKRGLLDISFIPIIYREGTYWKLLSCKISILPTLKPQARNIRHRADGSGETAPRWAKSSVLASGQWVKVTLTDDGIYYLSHSALSSMGFANPQNIRVYGHGGHLMPEVFNEATLHDDLQPVALMAVDGGYLFFANGLMTWQNNIHSVNHYARTASYFITEGQPDIITAADQTLTVTATPETVNTFKAFTTFDPDEYAWFQGGRQLFENYDYATGSSRSYTLTLPTYADVGTATLRIAFSAANSTSTSVTPSFNGTQLTTFTCNKLGSYEYAQQVVKTFTVASPSQSNVVRIKSQDGQHARLNYIDLIYTGLMKLGQDASSFMFKHQTNDGPALFSIEYSTGQKPQLWRVDEYSGLAVSFTGTTRDVTEADGSVHHYFEAIVPHDGIEHSYIVFDANAATAFPQPDYASSIANQDLHADSLIDMVIITPASGIFDQQAQALADLHTQWDNLRVKVVRADQIYNEFSSGTPDATAYRHYLKMLYDRASTDDDAPRYLLLFGDAAWDNRMYSVAWRNYNPDNFLLAFESENSISDTQCYVMEDYFGLLDDGEGDYLPEDKTDVGVGRLPVRSATEATAMVNKIVSYVEGSQAGAWKNVVSFLGDDGDRNEHLRYADDVANIVANLHPQLEVRKVMWDAYKRQSSSSGNRYPSVEQIIRDQMEEGAVMMNYTGHAATYCLSHEQVLRIEDFTKFSSPRTPLWVTAACDVMPFDTQKDNIGETAMLNESGAAIAFFGTTRTVYADNNLYMNRAFCRAVFNSDNQGRANRIGDAVRIAKLTVIDGGTDGVHPVNKLHYALLGDPALKLGSVSNYVILDSINGIALSDLPAGYTLKAGSRNRFSGHLAAADNSPLTDFNGTLSARLFDSQNTITCLNNANEKNLTPFTFSTFDKILYNGTDSISNGTFSITCPMPIDMSYSNETGRILFYAISNDRHTEASGYDESFHIGGTQDNLTDITGPDITAWLGNEDFTDGGTVGATPYFVAYLHDESGINTSDSSLGHNLELIVDNNPSTTYILNDYFTNTLGDYSSGTVAFSLPTLTAGTHSLLFRAWDMLNNTSSTTLNFVVDPSLKTSILNLAATNSPATTYTQFVISYDRPGSICNFTLDIFDFTGRLLWQQSLEGSNQNGIYTIGWDLTTAGGKALGSGIYLYRVRVSCDESEETSETKKIVINRR